MKRIRMVTLCLALILALWGCGAETAPEPETAAAQTEAVTVPTETMPTEPEHNIEIYELDTRNYSFSFEKVLLQIDWTDMTFALKCFDGSVVTGTVERKPDNIICTYEGGRMILSQCLHDGKLVWSNRNFIHGEDRYYAVDQRMFCPQTDMVFSCEFVLAEDQGQEVAADPEADALDRYKHLYCEAFSFQAYVPGKEDPAKYDPCTLSIRHYPLADKWEFQNATKSDYGSVTVTAVEDPDGSIVFSYGGKQWKFHREEDFLVYDGGSPLVAGNWYGIKEREYLEMELPASTKFRPFGEDYVYDALYILPGSTLEECYTAIQLDTKNQYVKIQCWDGSVLRGPFTYGDEYCDYLVFRCEVPDYVGTRTVQIDLMPGDHALCIRNPWMMSICPEAMGEGNYFYLFPVQGVTPQETLDE